MQICQLLVSESKEFARNKTHLIAKPKLDQRHSITKLVRLLSLFGWMHKSRAYHCDKNYPIFKSHSLSMTPAPYCQLQ